jgi:16S rRNA (cytosine1402-N4)-methyltransferase
MDRNQYHRPVLAETVVDLLQPVGDGIVIDATFGGGGHTRRLLGALGGDVTLVGIDRDPRAQANGAELGITVLAGDFGDFDLLLDRAGIGAISGVLFDFGISSHQVDDPKRGFSYRQDGPLDMRMDPTSGQTAAELVNSAEPRELVRILRRFGEERDAERIVAAIVAERPFSRTVELAETVARAVPAARRREGHPARKTFQALRIVVNHELDSVASGLDQAIARLSPGGRCVTIAYHSLEDRIVKQRFVEGARGCVCPPDLPVCGCGANPQLRLLTRKAIKPAPEEIDSNPRARSARLRAAEKVAA